MQKKYQVFVSSTFRDLAEERQDAIRNILDLGHIPAGMELFPASDTDQLDYIKKVIDECDYYVLIMGGRYGSLDAQGISYTEREYDYAVATDKVVLAFPHADLPSLPVNKSDISPRMQENLAEFRKKVMSGRLVREWTSREQLDGLVIKALARAVNEFPAVGWIRANLLASEDSLQEIVSLREKNDQLVSQNTELRKAVEPSIIGLSSDDEIQTLRFTYRKKGYNTQYHDEDCVVKLTWNEIFRSIGQELNMGRSSTLISTYIVKYLKENRGEERSLYLYVTDAAIVKNQLAALGLLTTIVSKGTDEKLYEFMYLSITGKKKLAEMLAVKSSAEAR